MAEMKLSFGAYVGKVELDGELVDQWVCDANIVLEDEEDPSSFIMPYMADGSVIGFEFNGANYKLSVDRSVEEGYIQVEPMPILSNGTYDVREVDSVLVNVGGLSDGEGTVVVNPPQGNN